MMFFSTDSRTSPTLDFGALPKKLFLDGKPG